MFNWKFITLLDMKSGLSKLKPLLNSWFFYFVQLLCLKNRKGNTVLFRYLYRCRKNSCKQDHSKNLCNLNMVWNMYQIHGSPYICKFLYWLQHFYSTVVHILQLISNGKRMKRQFFLPLSANSFFQHCQNLCSTCVMLSTRFIKQGVIN